MEILDLLTILKDGESSVIEFKETFTKELSKSACAFANTKGGKILLGIKDDGTPIGLAQTNIDQEISNVFQSLRPMPKFQIDHLPIASKKLIVIKIEESSQLVSCKNIVYIRAGTNNYPLSIEEVIEKSAESLRIFFDQMITEINASELNQNIFKNYLKVRQKTRGVLADSDITDIALRLGILKRKGSGLFMTNAGLLCFTNDPQKYLGNSVVRLTKFNDNEMSSYSEQTEFSGPLQKIVGDIEKYFVDHLNRVGGFTVGFKRQDFLEYPLSAIREAVINAVIHRNYFDAADIRIFIFPDRVEIKNPGSFPPGISVENPEHKPRNPLLAQYFYDLGLSEKYGSGIKKIKKVISEHPLAGVRFDIKPYNTAVIFYKSLADINLDSLNIKILETLTKNRKRSGEIAKSIGLSKQSTIERLKNLNSLGFIRQNGEGPKTTYSLTKLITSG